MRFILHAPHGAVSEWDPHDPPHDLSDDARYWSEAFRALPRTAAHTVVLTWSISDLPVEGPDVVAVVLPDEASRRPAYAPRVGAVFKCYGDRPRFTRAPTDALGQAIFIQEARRWFEALRDPRSGARAFPIPLGLVRPLAVTPRPMAERDLDVAFMGSVEQSHRRLPIAKIVSRRQMLEALPRGAYVRTTTDFGASIDAGADLYADELGRTKILLAPRGGSVETFRFNEGMMSGCVVITEPLPPFAFYRGSPAVTVRRWRDLPHILKRLLADPAELARRGDASRAWWNEWLSPQAVGRYIAARLP